MGRVGKYNGDALSTYEKIMDGMRTYTVNQVYKNEKHSIYYYVSSHGYMHVLRPTVVRMSGKILYYAIADYLLTKDNMLQSKGWNGRFETIQAVVDELERRIA